MSQTTRAKNTTSAETNPLGQRVAHDYALNIQNERIYE